MGFRTTQLIHVAAKLGIADVLKDGPQDASALARAVGAHPRALYRLLRALACAVCLAPWAAGAETPAAHRLTQAELPPCRA